MDRVECNFFQVLCGRTYVFIQLSTNKAHVLRYIRNDIHENVADDRLTYTS